MKAMYFSNIPPNLAQTCNNIMSLSHSWSLPVRAIFSYPLPHARDDPPAVTSTPRCGDHMLMCLRISPDLFPSLSLSFLALYLTSPTSPRSFPLPCFLTVSLTLSPTLCYLSLPPSLPLSLSIPPSRPPSIPSPFPSSPPSPPSLSPSLPPPPLPPHPSLARWATPPRR